MPRRRTPLPRHRHQRRRPHDRVRVRRLPQQPTPATSGTARRSSSPTTARAFSSTPRPNCASRPSRMAWGGWTRSSSRTPTPTTSWASTTSGGSTRSRAARSTCGPTRGRTPPSTAASATRSSSRPAEMKVYRPHLVARTIAGPFDIAGVTWTPIPLMHGELPVLGFRVGRLAYCTDVSFIPESSYPLLEDLDVLVLDAAVPPPRHALLHRTGDRRGEADQAESGGSSPTSPTPRTRKPTALPPRRRSPRLRRPARDRTSRLTTAEPRHIWRILGPRRGFRITSSRCARGRTAARRP